jgi:mannose-6-phosphate isomerase-like protein (cupin superfamily)
MRPLIKRFSVDTEFATPEGCHIIEVSNSPDDPGLSIARARIEPGVTTRWHRLAATAERYVILEGSGRVELGDGAPREVRPGDVVLIPPQCAQRITNTGTTDLIFLAICTPRFTDACYESL